MVIITNHKQLYNPHYLKGKGFVQKEIYGNGIALDAVKMLGRKLLKFGKFALRNHIFPKGKELISKNKEMITNVLSQQSKNILSNLLDKAKRKEGLNQIKEESKNILNNNKQMISAQSREILNDLLTTVQSSPLQKRTVHEGAGLKIVRNPYKY